ncbi:FadR/GntR family transcriptional regulator [Sphingomonas montana]|uniref:FadR/GntR family transcriptional regulator n=1 Tax=Sphingomonas montana TaxID=1843236 RepID=UPI00096EE1FA|nr:FadR/GntR family transcriptional regulator [Sphingomonas montana]
MISTSPSIRTYARVSANLQERISCGEYGIGARLPPERELAQIYNVSRPTIREAIIALEVDGVVSVRQGSGVYVIAKQPRTGIAGETDIGPFELLEARRAIEGEACALAATQIDIGQLQQLDALVDEMQGDNLENDIPRSEQADRQFHMVIAEASGNSAMSAVVDLLWDIRFRSPQSRMLTTKAHLAGIKPRVEEHVAIVDALRRSDPVQARAAMRLHLERVLETLLETTEIQEVNQARDRVHQQRRRFAGRG